MSDSDTDSDDSYDSESLLQNKEKPTPKWDLPRIVPPEADSGSAVKNIWWIRSEKLLKVIAYIAAFLIILCASIASKGTLVFMLKQISLVQTNLPFCNKKTESTQWISDTIGRNFEVNYKCDASAAGCETQQAIEKVAWIWGIAFAFVIPQIFVLKRSFYKYCFKFVRLPSLLHFTFVLVMEVLHTVGLAVLVFLALPDIDSARVLMLTASLATVPACLLLLSRLQEDNYSKSKVSWAPLAFDILAVLAQLSGALLWPLLQVLLPSTSAFAVVEHPRPWAITIGVLLASCGWWQTYAEEKSHSALGKFLWDVKIRMTEKGGSRYFIYLIIAPIKIGIFLGAAVVIPWYTGAISNPSDLKDYFYASFNTHQFSVIEVINEDVSGASNFVDGIYYRTAWLINDPGVHATKIIIIQITTSLAAYVTSKFAAKVQIQEFSFALPISLTTPACLAILLFMCGARASDSCFFQGSNIPSRLFFQCPATGSLISYSWHSSTWIFLIWLVSYLWVTAHIWFPRSARLGSTEQIFSTPAYDGLFIDQSLMLNRRRDGLEEITTKDLDDKDQEEKDGFANAFKVFPAESTKSSVKASDSVTKIYACATMWHESKEEMLEMLKSLYRVDSDYSARRLSQKYLGVVDPDYYEWETHILFDNCMEMDDRKDRPENGQVVNPFVRQLVDIMNTAASNHYGKVVKVKAPKTFPTPYGGRLIWTLPGKTRIVCHLKDKDKIRHKKRWSQIMYMYYLLGYKLMELPISDERKEVMAENTYLLALDGDVDFQPQAAIRLIDMLKKNKGVGAACGRIHPTGSSYMAFYQLFEYAIGHWLQKATEHVIGCVLCSPGCFSMFRAKAVMDDNVMRMYTTIADQAREHIQYDQGEDRWLCTLLLQRGWRVEYSAASDSFTACPETFDEFYNQRRRWMPSTLLNIWDLIRNWKMVTKNNEDISWFFMLYQMMIMIFTVIGPGGIVLAVAGNCAKVFGGDSMAWILGNAAITAVYCFICYSTDAKFQIAIAKVLTGFYSITMTAMIIGLIVEFANKGFLAPNAVSLLSFFGPLLLAAIFHPQEAYCFPSFIIYMITLPSMYVLLVIYSLFNMWNVSWGTREVAVKKTKAELEREKKDKEEAMAEEAKRKKNGLMGTILGGLNLGNLTGGSDDKGETASVDFSFGNVLRCMCFTREDPLEPKKQLVKISESLEDVAKRLSRIESVSTREPGGRRRSSVKGRKSMGSIHEADESNMELVEGIGGTDPAEGDDSSEEGPEEETPVVERDDETNPYWIEDDRLKLGKVDYLSGGEIHFWKEMIKKYLVPLEMSDKDKRDQKRGLEEYRDGIVFTIVMFNVLYITAITILQTQASVFLKWTWISDLGWDTAGQDGVFHNISFTPSEVVGQVATVTLTRSNMELDMLGLAFLLSFSLITVVQIIGMLFHRWQTACHYIATTNLKEDSAEEEIREAATHVARNLQNPDGAKTPEEERQEMLKGRRATIADLNKYHKEGKGGGETINLEKQFVKGLQNLGDLTSQDNKLTRGLSVRRDTLHALHARRASIAANSSRKKKSVNFGAKQPSVNGSGSFVNFGYSNDDDSDFAEEDFSDFTGSFRESGRNSYQFDYDTTEDKHVAYL